MILPASAGSLPSTQAEQFEGPLDLLLDEVRRQRVSIEKIAMAPIVARFLVYLRTATERNLNLNIEWLHMAATLIHWKSRALLPENTRAAPAADRIRDGLVQQLLAHRKEAAEELARRRSVEQDRFSRPDELREAGAEEPEESLVSVWDLMQQARDIERWVREQGANRRQLRETFGIEKDEVTVAEMTKYLRGRLDSEEGKLDGASLIHAQPSASRKACLFLGMLELVREQHLQIQQTEYWGPMLLWRRDSENATTRYQDPVSDSRT